MNSSTPKPDPLPHLIAAVTSLSFALRDLDASRPTPGALAQDGQEHVDEIVGLLSLIEQKLRSPKS